MRSPFSSHAFFTGCVLAAAVAGTATGQTAVTRASVSSGGVQGDAASGQDADASAISADGRFVAFRSSADDLVPGDTNLTDDVFVHDRLTGATVRVSVDSSGTEANDYSVSPALSADGRFVAFMSGASNLVPGDTNGMADIFVHDRDPDGNGLFDEGNGVTLRMSLRTDGAQANWFCMHPAISADGRFVAFDSAASNLVANDKNGKGDVFLRDRDPDGNGIFDEGNSTTTRVSVATSGAEANGDSAGPSLSADGAIVAFESWATNLVANDGNKTDDVFVRDLAAGVTERVSVDSNGTEGNAFSFLYPKALSADGGFVAFVSSASNLVAGDTNGALDVFVRDRTAATTTRVSVDATGAQGDGASSVATISGDGASVAFVSAATNFDTRDGNGVNDVFVHDLATGTTTACSLAAGFIGDAASASPALSDDGTLVVYVSDADNLVSGDTNAVTDVFVLDRTLNNDGTKASWWNYGAGFPGTLGIPTFTVSANPVLGTSIALDVADSLGLWTTGFLFAGLSEASTPTNLGGTLLVGNILLFMPFPLPPYGASLPVDVPLDVSLSGIEVDLQVLAIDSGAARGVSFTPGVALLLGN